VLFRSTAALALFLAAWNARPVVCLGDLSDYYDFGDMEILKLDWELGTPLASDLNGDSLNDLVVCKNRKARIELLLQDADGRMTRPVRHYSSSSNLRQIEIGDVDGRNDVILLVHDRIIVYPQDAGD
jgi:hypothetical protein